MPWHLQDLLSMTMPSVIHDNAEFSILNKNSSQCVKEFCDWSYQTLQKNLTSRKVAVTCRYETVQRGINSSQYILSVQYPVQNLYFRIITFLFIGISNEVIVCTKSEINTCKQNDQHKTKMCMYRPILSTMAKCYLGI